MASGDHAANHDAGYLGIGLYLGDVVHHVFVSFFELLGIFEVQSYALDVEFMDDLRVGMLNSILDAIRQDQSLEFQIRTNQVEVYYQGGKILDLKPKSSEGYYASFDENYCKLKRHTEEDLITKVHLRCIPKLPNHIMTKDDADKWGASLGQLKKVMDVWFVDH